MKPVATVHWIVKDKEHSKPVYDSQAMNEFIKNLGNENITHWTCMSSMTTRVPYQPFPEHIVNGQPKPIEQYFKRPVQHA